MKRVILFLNACLLCGHVIAGNDVELASTGDVQSGKTYKVGDYYNENGKERVVFEVDATGRHGKIVSMKQSLTGMRWCIEKKLDKSVVTGAADKINGMNNMRKVMRIKGWRKKYPAFAWCAALGDGWYLPAIEELKKFLLDDAVYNAVNLTLSQHGGWTFEKKGLYWSSLEKNSTYAWVLQMSNGYTGNIDKYNKIIVRAVSVF